MQPRIHLALAVLGCGLLAACGTPGAPRPPSLELPRPATDLAASRVGDRVTLTWTAPTQTTDRQNIRHPGPVRVCRGVNAVGMLACTEAVAKLPPGPTVNQQGKPEIRQYTDVLPPDLQKQYPTGFATYALEALNLRGRSAGLSNQVEAPLAPTLPPPADFRAQLTPDGILLTWTGLLHQHEAPELGHFYRVFRHTPGAPTEIAIGDVKLSTDPHAGFLDRTFEWQKTYLYRIAVVTSVARSGQPPIEVQGQPSPEITVVAHDIFPPAVPAGLQAVASGVGQPPFVDLTWAPNTESDLAGYNLYRRQAGQPPVKINPELVKTPAYRDRTVVPGHTYFYAVTAVDLRGNESPRSEDASEAVP
jgi:hypothetical protein